MTYFDAPSHDSAGPAAYPQPQLYSLRGLAIALQVLLAGQAVTSVTSIVATLHQSSLIDRLRHTPRSVSYAEATDADGTLGAIVTVQAVLYLATAAVWIVWLFRARRNVQHWGAPFERWRVGWTIGGWFIPIVNLVVPALVTRDIADGTDADADDISGRRWPQPAVLCWSIAWAVLLVVSVTDRNRSRDLERAGVTFGDIDSALRWDLATDVVMLVAIAAAVVLVRSLTRRQHERMATGRAG